MNSLGNFNIIYGSSIATGMRNVLFGDNINVFGDYNVVVGDHVSHPAILNLENKSKDEYIKVHKEALEVYKNLDEKGISPKGFYQEAKIVITIICAIVESSKVKEEAAPSQEETPKETVDEPKVVEVVDEPTTMKK